MPGTSRSPPPLPAAGGRLGLALERAPVRQLLRSVVSARGAPCLNFAALKYLPITVTTTIAFAQPIVITLLAIPILGEVVGIRRLIAVCVGFVGVLVVVQPWGLEFHPAMFLSLGALSSPRLLRHDADAGRGRDQRDPAALVERARHAPPRRPSPVGLDLARRRLDWAVLSASAASARSATSPRPSRTAGRRLDPGADDLQPDRLRRARQHPTSSAPGRRSGRWAAERSSWPPGSTSGTANAPRPAPPQGEQGR